MFENRHKAIEHMTTKHNCKNPEQMLDKYINDRTDPFDPNKKLPKHYSENYFEVIKYLEMLKAKEEEYSKKNRELYPADKIKMNKANSVESNITNKKVNKEYSDYQDTRGGSNDKAYKGKKQKHSIYNNNNKKNKKEEIEYITEEFEDENGVTVIRKIPKSLVDSQNNHIKDNQKIVNKENQNFNNKSGFNQVKVAEKPVLKIQDYTSFFTQYYNDLKKYITEKIKKEEIPEEQVMIPIEVGYQLIVIISKLEYKEMAELKFITNFKFDYSIVEELQHCFARTPKYDIIDTVSTFPLSNLLVLYKYIHICYLKATDAYYKRDHDEVEENIYDEFLPSNKPKKVKEVKSALTYTVNKSKKQGNFEKVKKKGKIVQPQSFNNKNDIPPYVGHNVQYEYNPQNKEEIEQSSKSKLKGLFEAPPEEKMPHSKSEINSTFKNDNNQNDEYFQEASKKSKLNQIFSQGLSGATTVVKKSKKKGGFKGITDDDFPELK